MIETPYLDRYLACCDGTDERVMRRFASSLQKIVVRADPADDDAAGGIARRALADAEAWARAVLERAP